MNPEVAQTLLDQALSLHRQGQPDAALPLYGAIARSLPQMAELRRLMGIAELDLDRPQTAAARLKTCLALQPAHGPALCGLGAALRRTGALTTAVSLMTRATTLAPANPGFQANLGYALLDAGEAAAAVRALRRGLAGDREDSQAWLALADAAARLADPATARTAARRALALDPDLAAAWLAISAAAVRRGDRDGAGGPARRAVRLTPDDAEAWTSTADLDRDAGRERSALAATRRALALDPAHAGAWRVAAAVLAGTDAAAAGRAVDRALTLIPDDADAWAGRGLAALAHGFPDTGARHIRRALALEPAVPAILNNLGMALLAGRHPERAAGVLERASRLTGTGTLAAAMAGAVASNHLLALNYLPSIGDDALAEAHKAWGRAATAAARAAGGRPPAAGRGGGKGRLRVGYVSPNLKRHPVGYFLAGVLEHHDRRRFDILCYSDTSGPDDLTRRLTAATDLWRDVRGRSDTALEAQIRADGVDILIDLAGHTADNRLGVFATRPAPCQASWLGYFHTTGLPTIDAVLTDADSVPADAHGWFSEKIIALAEGRFCYAPPVEAPAVAPPPLMATGRPMFASFNNLAKLGPAVLDLWAELLNRHGTAGLTLKWHTLAEPGTRAALSAAFARRGVDPDRLVLRGGSGHAAMLADYATVDVALDPFPFNGCLTTLEALWMGVPVVTLAGRRPVARQSLAILRRIGQDDLIATSPADFIDTARHLVADPAALAARRAALRGLVAARLCDAAAFTRALETALEALWAQAGGRSPEDR